MRDHGSKCRIEDVTVRLTQHVTGGSGNLTAHGLAIRSHHFWQVAVLPLQSVVCVVKTGTYILGRPCGSVYDLNRLNARACKRS
jgi:hypothetical protein